MKRENFNKLQGIRRFVIQVVRLVVRLGEQVDLIFKTQKVVLTFTAKSSHDPVQNVKCVAGL